MIPMPSENQSNTSGTEYDDEWDKLLHKPEQVIEGIIDGLRTVDECQAALEHEVNGQQRAEVIGWINQRKAELKND